MDEEFDPALQQIIIHNLRSTDLKVSRLKNPPGESEEIPFTVVNENSVIVNKDPDSFIVQVSSDGSTYADIVSKSLE